MALREGGARSVMNSYAEVDGVPAAADEARLTGLLREQWGFEGVVVADYFAVAFLRTLQRVAGSDGEAAGLALRAGIDVELPSPFAYTGPLAAEVRAGRVSEGLVDRALVRVLRQKAELGLLDPDWAPASPDVVDLDPPADQELALRLAREAVVLLDAGDVLPLAPGAHLAVVGPLADDPFAMLGCYSFPAHVGVHHPEAGLGIGIPSLLSELTAVHDGPVTHAPGCDVQAPGRDGFERAVELARDADVAVVAVGDRAGLFGRGTSGEGCDAADLALPGEQAALVEAVLATGTPVVLVVLSGRPYALGAYAGRAALVQTFFPGERGGRAIAEVLAGAVNPSGHLPVQVPREPGAQPGTYLAPPLGLRTDVSNLDPTPLYPFGFGRSYAELTWGEVTCEAIQWSVSGDVEVGVELANETEREAADVVQLYLHDPVAQVTRPDVRLVGYRRVTLAPGERARVTFTVPADVASFPGLAGHRIVEPGEVELRVARSAADVHHAIPLVLVGPERRVGFDRRHLSTSAVAVDADLGARA
ncbi:MAG: hypothetical protein BGO96_07580 [Micrococcales bacterium 73-15]|nr:MAG: hypothetical protein BGO96_07580 [Micrococcales bacterium 73-15]